MAENFPTEIPNHDIVFLYDNVSRFYQEVTKSQSSPISGMTTADQNRLLGYLAHLKHAINWVNQLPELDLPESHPNPRKLEPFPAEVNVENENVNMVGRLLKLLAVELVNSQSARASSRLMKHDLQRVVAIVTKIESFVVDFIQNGEANPLDMPESSPEDPLPPRGLMGVSGSHSA